MKIPEPVSVREIARGRSSSRNSLIGWLLEALYISRSREARRAIHRYRHLLAEECHGRPRAVTAAAPQARECSANADRDKTPLHAIHRTFEDA